MIISGNSQITLLSVGKREYARKVTVGSEGKGRGEKLVDISCATMT